MVSLLNPACISRRFLTQVDRVVALNRSVGGCILPNGPGHRFAKRKVWSMEWLTEPRQLERPFGNWANHLAAAFVQLEPREFGEQPFRGAITRTDAGRIKVSLVTATRHRVLRLRSHIARSTDDLCFINLQIEGMGRYTQRGHEQICGPGDLAVVDTTEPFEIANARDFRLFCFAVPRCLLPGKLYERPSLRTASTPAGRALSKILYGYAELCLGQTTGSEVSARYGTHIVDLITQAAYLEEDGSQAQAKEPVLLSMMLDHLGRCVTDPDLSAESLARTFRCSERYVHKLFTATGRTVGQHLNDRRVALCAQRLIDRQERRTIAEIAFEVGFRDISHFNRLFKRSHGITPRELRRSIAAEVG
jgi:AraC family transcriptional regulator, positive regulator of tynA and feaB